MKGQPPGEANANAKLTEAIVRDVFTADGTDLGIATDRGLGRSIVYRIRAGLSWTHITKHLIRGKTVREELTREERQTKWTGKHNELSLGELHQRLAIASCLKLKHRGGSILEDPAIDELLPV